MKTKAKRVAKIIKQLDKLQRDYPETKKHLNNE